METTNLHRPPKNGAEALDWALAQLARESQTPISLRAIIAALVIPHNGECALKALDLGIELLKDDPNQVTCELIVQIFPDTELSKQAQEILSGLK